MNYSERRSTELMDNTLTDFCEFCRDTIEPRLQNTLSSLWSHLGDTYLYISSVSIDFSLGDGLWIDFLIKYGVNGKPTKQMTLSIPKEELYNVEFICGCFYTQFLSDEEKDE